MAVLKKKIAAQYAHILNKPISFSQLLKVFYETHNRHHRFNFWHW